MENLVDLFYWRKRHLQEEAAGSGADAYIQIVEWSLKARGRNPDAFDQVTDWVLDDRQWTNENLASNERILMHDILGMFRDQNAWLRSRLKALEASAEVNPAVYPALDQFDAALSGTVLESWLQEDVSRVFADFRVMRLREVREIIAGSRTGPSGTDSVALFGYLNVLKDLDAGVQWALFMPELVKQQQNGFKVEQFLYRKTDAMRFIGKAADASTSLEGRRDLFRTLDALSAYQSELREDILLTHHFGLGVDKEPCHGFWGRFMMAETPVPDGFEHFEFIPNHNGSVGVPFCSQFAYAVFSGDMEAMHRREGYDVDAMYDVTRNIMLGQGAHIPYPDKYWTAEVFPDGHEKDSTAYLFSALI